ncbi:MAG TPA: TonB-dependent receptor plug domain-containing protein [Chitinophagaceae bacterium]|nr:TonB-dependent receptor plug domain-containing protein [Chitinophagaceae bacterium]
MKKGCIVILMMVCCWSAKAQERVAADTARVDTLAQVIVTGFEQNRNRMVSGTSVNVQYHNDADFNNKVSLVHAFNTAAGVRMEERSPGSYRLNIRGSTLRSPFGVRNVKVYWNDIPLTDPGGNTYLNQLAFNNFSSIEIHKGPAASLYGAGTGGLLLIQTLDNNRRHMTVEYMAGSYGLQNIFATARTGQSNSRGLITFAHNQHDGYRNQSAMRRNNFSWSSSFKVSPRQELRANVLFTDLFYQTPGGLTKAEFDVNPRAARPAAGGFPSAEQARAAIYQKNLLAGVQHRYQLDTHWFNNTSVYVAYAEIKNPAIRNYERRSEPHAGARSVFGWQQKNPGNEIKLVAGAELQYGFFNTSVFNNRQGNPDTLQTDDDIRYNTYVIFTQADLVFDNKWFITAGTSVNRTKVEFTRLNKYPVTTQEKTYGREWAPRISVLRKLSEAFSVLGIVSKGFSPPSMAELLPSTGVISTHLEAERGWNYEAIVRHNTNLPNGFLHVDVSAYYFSLKNTLVVRKDASGADFFINAGDTKQKGIEASLTFLKNFDGFLDNIYMEAGYTYSHFRYGSFVKDTIDFSGKTLPSVPGNIFSVLMDFRANNGLYTYASYYYASRIFLNDANTASAKPYHLLGWRLGWQRSLGRWVKFSIYAGADNLLDQVYSLGNDINDPRGRYYNTAPRRNYYAGIALSTPGK